MTGRVSVTGPVEAHVDEGALVDSSVPDTVFGHEALPFDPQPHDVAFHRWVWTDDEGSPPGSEPTTPVLVEVAPGTAAWSWAAVEELPDMQAMLDSLRRVGAADPRLATYGTD